MIAKSKFARGVTKVEGVFDDKTFDFIDKESCDKLDDPYTRYGVNKTNWAANDPYIANYSQAGTILFTDVSDLTKDLMLAAIREHVAFDFDHETTRFTHNYMFRGAFIPWHDDTHCDVAITFYFQDVDPNMGGLYLYSKSDVDRGMTFEPGKAIASAPIDDIKGICPRKNTLLIQHHVPHSVSALTPMTPVRRSIQAFLHFAK